MKGKSGREAELWSTEMMSEEEEVTDDIRQPPSYSSDALNAFIVKLNTRLQSKCTDY